MAIIDSIVWQPQGSEVVYAYRYPASNLSTYTQLIVQESQEALLFSKGKLMGKFGPGKHTLNTENLPILRSLYGIPFGGKNPFTAEVWFVNKVQTFSIDWKIDRMSIHDVDYNTNLPLVASGQYGLKVVDSEKFLIKLVGTHYTFTQREMTEQSYGEFCSKTKSSIMQFMIANKVGYKQISAFLDPISSNLRIQMQEFWSNLGLELTKFYVTSIELDDSTEDGRRIRDAIAQQASMSITGHTWQQEQVFGTANNAIDGMGNIGGQGGLLGSLLAIQMMGGMANAGSGVGTNVMQPNYNQPTFGGQATPMDTVSQQTPQVREIYCANCSKKFSSNQAFCPHCGKKYSPCPRCGSDNVPTAHRCVSCGAPLSQVASNTTCSSCGATLVPGAQFCSHCGAPQTGLDNVCPRCGAEMSPTMKFCPKCGNKR